MLLHTILSTSMNQTTISQFITHIWNFYQTNKRSFAWRNIDCPYHILVSEVMLQQTQTERIATKYPLFLSQFPTIQSLAAAPLHTVLDVWQGLGYNRRARYLHQTALRICNDYHGVIPDDPAILITFPGIGAGTAGSIPAFAYNKPTIFIETNIRATFIDYFFSNKTGIKDCDIMPLIQASVSQDNAREWYYALMDYGAMLKKSGFNPCTKSAHHTKQSKFKGSDRQLRGLIIRALLRLPASLETILEFTQEPAPRITKIMAALCDEKLIVHRNNLFHIFSS